VWKPAISDVRYVLIRLLYTLPVIWLVVSAVFLLIHLVPGDPIQAMLGEGAPSADLEAARHAYGLDIPLGSHTELLEGNLPRRLGEVHPASTGTWAS